MSRKKKIEKNEFIYCNQRNCTHTECLRHNNNTPFNTLILRDKFNPDKDWNCKDIITER